MKLLLNKIAFLKVCNVSSLTSKAIQTKTSGISSEKSFFITTPIFYVNSVPHIGHLYTTLLADAQNRFQKLLGKSKTFLSTGTDEHGMKILQAASAQNLSPQTFCDQIASQFKSIFNAINIQPDAFVRTTDEAHRKAVCQFWSKLCDRGYIYSGTYEGWYCTSDEMFVPQVQVEDARDPVSGVLKKVSAASGHPVEWTSEQNYMFKLSHFQSDLLSWLKDENIVKPRKFHDILVAEVQKGLHDISVSRERIRLPWGIPVPDDETQTIYVWLDALINYLTVRGYPNADFSGWPVDFQVIGKEILKFHGIYWPAFLMAVGLEPPRHLLVHSHWTVNYKKMSKSVGNVIDPVSRMQCYSSEGLRYYLLRDGVPHSDGNYSDAKVEKILNAELANTLGNLLNRCTSKSLNKEKQFISVCPHAFIRHCSENGQNLVNNVRQLPTVVRDHYSEFNFYHGIEAIMGVLRDANGFLHSQKPWESTVDEKVRQTVVGVVMETLRVSGIILQPIVPSLADNLLTKLGVSRSRRQWLDAEQCFIRLSKGQEGTLEKHEISNQSVDSGILFQRVKVFQEMDSKQKKGVESKSIPAMVQTGS